MSLLKQIFSPRRLLIWLFLIILIITVPEITRPSLSQTEAVVTMLCLEKVDDKIEVSTKVLTPSHDKNAEFVIFTGVGNSIGEAIDNVSLSIGKEMGFAQCEIIGFGEKICEEGIIPSLDFFTRTKRVGRNAVLVSFTGETRDFAQVVADMNTKKSLKLTDVLNYDKRYILIEDSNIDSFYKGYFSEISLGIMPQIKIETQDSDNAIQVQSSGVGTDEQAGNQTSNESKKYLINDGTTYVFKKGKKYLVIEPEMIKKINLFANNAQEGVVKVENVSDDLYNNATIILTLQDKSIKIKPTFENGKPVYEASVDLTVLIEEVMEEQPNKKFLRRNKAFLTPALISKIEETVNQEMFEAIEFCKQNKVDLIDVYRQFYSLKNKEFENYYTQEKENYLDNIEYKTSVKIAVAF